jgi:hypothetical protein
LETLLKTTPSNYEIIQLFNFAQDKSIKDCFDMELDENQWIIIKNYGKFVMENAVNKKYMLYGTMVYLGSIAKALTNLEKESPDYLIPFFG